MTTFLLFAAAVSIFFTAGLFGARSAIVDDAAAASLDDYDSTNDHSFLHVARKLELRADVHATIAAALSATAVGFLISAVIVWVR